MLYYAIRAFDSYLECLIVSTLVTAIDGRSIDDKIVKAREETDN